MAEIKFSLVGVDNVLKTLKSLPPEVVSKNGGPVRSAMAKGAKYMMEREKEELGRVLELRAEKKLSTGLLKKNIVYRRGKNDRFKGERYVVKVSQRQYVRTSGDKKVSTRKTAHILEYGSVKQTATPFIRPTFEKNKEKVFSIIMSELDKKIAIVVKKLRKPVK